MKRTFTLVSKYRNEMLDQIMYTIKSMDGGTIGGVKDFDYLPISTSVCTDEVGSTIHFDGNLHYGKVKVREVIMNDVNYRSNMTRPTKSLSKKDIKKLTDRINAILETI